MAEAEDNWSETPAAMGGCQCGTVRYRIAAGPTRASVCHCRMCQRQVGGPYAAFLKLAASQVTWLSEPAWFASSDIAERGFCQACGTPLAFRDFGSEWIEITAGSLPAGFPFAPTVQFGIESRHGWIDHLAALPGEETTEQPVSHQSQDGA
ncbi:GFA family protein [Frigidibacter sp.]|uniref:GFA family protein n=1 Tax=Frigidibacter sp. TaxID=2586418 RepID=UPI002732B1FD|nr:GFA family protein [Frigidibacter sp.]MDP3338700.1 GFA family protein [Frigidibacter sp.]